MALGARAYRLQSDTPGNRGWYEARAVKQRWGKKSSSDDKPARTRKRQRQAARARPSERAAQPGWSMLRDVLLACCYCCAVPPSGRRGRRGRSRRGSSNRPCVSFLVSTAATGVNYSPGLIQHPNFSRVKPFKRGHTGRCTRKTRITTFSGHGFFFFREGGMEAAGSSDRPSPGGPNSRVKRK